jgi:riboflavin biosynthesis pyrimidine reductase
VLGGGQLNAAWLAAGLVDEVWLTVESALFGQGVTLTGGGDGPDLRLWLKEAKVLAEGGPVSLRYEVRP